MKDEASEAFSAVHLELATIHGSLESATSSAVWACVLTRAGTASRGVPLVELPDGRDS